MLNLINLQYFLLGMGISWLIASVLFFMYVAEIKKRLNK